MLTPHHGKNAELSEVRFASENFLNLLEFFRRKAVLFDQLGCNRWIGVWCFARHLPNVNEFITRTQIAEIASRSNRRSTNRVKRLTTGNVRPSLQSRIVEVKLIKKEA